MNENPKFAEHADAGDVHLETRYVAKALWEWEVISIKGRTRIDSGSSTSLTDAKKAAMACAKVESAEWGSIGPEIISSAD